MGRMACWSAFMSHSSRSLVVFLMELESLRLASKIFPKLFTSLSVMVELYHQIE